MIEVETQTTEVEVINNVEVTSTNQVEVETVDLSNLDITIAKKEYVITGDDIYIPMLYDDAPQWMKDLVQLVVDVSISSGNQNLINDLSTMLQDFAVSYVPLNQYTQTILDLGDEDTRINALIETLNSNFNDGLSTANAQIISLQLTKASKDEVVAQVIQTIAAQLADGTSNIGSIIGRIDQAIANETSARATSFQVLTSSLEDTNLDIAANATATHILNTYVGLNDATGDPNGTGLLADVSAIASDVTTLSTNLQSGAGTWASADSNLTNSLSTSIINGDVAVESKFAYNSIVNINGVYKKSGFGLTTNYTSGSGTELGSRRRRFKKALGVGEPDAGQSGGPAGRPGGFGPPGGPEGPGGPGFRWQRCDRKRLRYLRRTKARWMSNRVEGRKMTAARVRRRG